jgi:hypothetical protein
VCLCVFGGELKGGVFVCLCVVVAEVVLQGLQGCYSGVAGALQGFYRGVTRVLQRYNKSVRLRL